MEETVEDRSIEFLLKHSSDAALPDLTSLLHTAFTRTHWRESFDNVVAAARESVWDLKTQLDAIDSETYLATRNQLFPLAASGQVSARVSNRAGHKLIESMDATGVWQRLQKNCRKRSRGVAFADVCGGPGAFTQVLFATGSKYGFRDWHGYGMTLAGVEGLDWYPTLSKKRFTATYGVTGTGDVFELANIEALASITSAENLQLVVADGGFHVDFSIANYQETISARIMYGQWLSALKLLRQGGCFVLKLFDTFSPFTRAVLFLSTFMYERVHIVKPKHSRVVNSERYLVCIGFTEVPSKWMEYLDRCYTEGFTVPDEVPELIPGTWAMLDKVFAAGVIDMNETIANNQRIALQMVIKAAPRVHEERMAAKQKEQHSDEEALVLTEECD